MALMETDGADLVIRLSAMEQVFALRRSWRVPRSLIQSARMVDDLWPEARGLRLGTGLPYVILLGTTHYRGGRDFVAIYGRNPGVVLEFKKGAPYSRALLSHPDILLVEGLAAAPC